MNSIFFVRRLVVAGATATVLFSGAATALATPHPAAPTADGAVTTTAAPSDPYSLLSPLADLSAQRLNTADAVAAAKWGTDSPIDAPDREQEVLETATQLAEKWGADPEQTVRIFRDQIEANKVVQRELHQLWDTEPSQAPTERPDLAEVRKEINRINEELVRSIAHSAPARSATTCEGELSASAGQVRQEKQLDALHSRALDRALTSVCSPESS